MVTKKAAAKTTKSTDSDAKASETPTSEHVSDQDPAVEIADRNTGDVPHDNRFHKTYTVPPTTIIAEDNWADSDGAEAMHNANKTALLEEALHRGLHPQDEPTFDGESTRSDGSVDLDYSVAVKPAHAVEHPVIETVTPSVELLHLGGDTTGDSKE
jgi:hypothetical protein